MVEEVVVVEEVLLVEDVTPVVDSEVGEVLALVVLSELDVDADGIDVDTTLDVAVRVLDGDEDVGRSEGR